MKNTKLIVELGTHKGASFFSMCQTVKDKIQLDLNKIKKNIKFK